MLARAILATFLAALGGLSHLAMAHPGESTPGKRVAMQAANMRHAFADMNYQALSKCDGDLARARKERAMKRRMETFLKLRKERGISDG